ncbi:MAG: hypothetical protein AAF533_10920 [Acidobacteriota bacterium]
MSQDERFDRIVRACWPLVDGDGQKEVRHYLEHGEPEMAFEGLMLELMTGDRFPSEVEFSDLQAMARAFRLDEESVFDGDFWEKFCRWGARFPSVDQT